MENNNYNNCSICGKKLKNKIQGRNSILYCEDHGEMIITSFFNEYELDHTKYQILLLPNNETSIKNIKLISTITKTNSLKAKMLLLSNTEVVIYDNYSENVCTATPIRHIARLLKESNIKFKINPEFKHKV